MNSSPPRVDNSVYINMLVANLFTKVCIKVAESTKKSSTTVRGTVTGETTLVAGMTANRVSFTIIDHQFGAFTVFLCNINQQITNC